MPEHDPKRTARVTTRFRERERRKLEREARERGIYLSELIREAALQQVRSELEGQDPADAKS